MNATSIEQMAALPSDAIFQYSGHALMYGINNRFHGITGDANNVGGGHSLPNAFGFDQAKMGLGNFVDATFNVGQKKVTGDVYSHPPKASYGVASPRRTTAYCLRRRALSETFGG